MKVYIDDIRDPSKHLTEEQADGIVWIKDAWEARNFLHNNQEAITVLHLDNFLGDDYITGSDLLYQVVGGRIWDGDEFLNLKQIYLHSSDEDVIDELYNTLHDEFEAAGVELIKNSQNNW